MNTFTIIDEDLMKRGYMRKTLMYITDDITIDQYDTEFCVSVWSGVQVSG